MPRQKQSRVYDDGIQKKSGKLNKNEAKRREDKLKMDLHLAEIGQVEEYIKNRSLEVDQEIEDTRKRMNLSMSMSNDVSRDHTAATHFTAKSNLHVDGQKFKEGMRKEINRTSKHDNDTDPSERHTESITDNRGNKNPTKEIEWRDLKERLVACLQDARMTPFQVTETFLPSELARENEVFLLLEEVIDVFQIDFINPMTENDKNLLLHFFGDKHATFVNIKELLTDLTYWDTNRRVHLTATHNNRNGTCFDQDDDLDQGLPEHFKNKTYGGHASTDMLRNSNTDTFRDGSARENHPHRRLMSATNPTAAGGSLYPITETEKSTANLESSSSASELFANEHTNTALNRSALADIHALVHSTASEGGGGFPPKSSLLNFDDYNGEEEDSHKQQKEETQRHVSIEESREDEEDDDEKLLALLRSHAEKEKQQMTMTSSVLEDNLAPPGDTSMSTDVNTQRGDKEQGGVIDSDTAGNSNKSIREVAAENVASQLALENERLKHELGAFDSEFFEELEDLKFKYAKLQDTVGEGPVIRTERGFDKYASARLSTSRPSPPMSPQRSSVDRVAWGSPAQRGSSTHAGMGRAPLASSLNGSRSRAHHDEYASHSNSNSRSNRHSDPLTELYMSRGSRPAAVPGSPSRSGPGHGIGIGYRASKTIDGHDLKRSIKEQVHSSIDRDRDSTDQNNFGSLCERRLIFELKSLSNPNKAATNLMHWVTEQSHQNQEHVGFVSCAQLQQILVQRLGLKMSAKEISLLAMGFASDGEDNINAEEFNTALQMLFHSSVGAEGHAETEEEAAWRLALETIRNLASDLLTHKKFAPLLRHRLQVLTLVESEDEVGLEEEINTVKVNAMDAVSKPFYLMDDNRNGIITAKGFTKIINFFSPGISDDEVKILVTAFKKQLDGQDQTRIENDYITEYRTQQLRGSLRGAASGSGTGELNSWLKQTLPGQQTGAEGKQLVEYKEFIDQLVEAVVDVILDLEAGVEQIIADGAAGGGLGDMTELDPRKGASSLPPLITGFGELIDTLLSHLESLPSTRRRQCLILLQTTLTKQSEAEGQAEGVGYLDGFAVLKALVAAGFPLPRSLRAKFLKDVEEMSEKFNFLELCRFLMSSCCNWSIEERQVIGKVLKAMGVTTEQRREWIIQLKKDLCLASADYKLNHASHSGHPVSFNDSKRKSSSKDNNWMQIVEDNLQDGVPASTFLHCLREAGVHLSVDDEATLLDCLDFECQALETTEEEATMDPLLMHAGRNTHNQKGSQGSGLSVSLIKYSNFLSVCSRHAGKWYQASPVLNEHLKHMLMDKQDADVIAGLKEFKLLLKTFDEDSSGRVSYRPFLISCRRSRILSQLEPEVVTELAKVLAEEGAGTVSYELFLLHLKSLYHQIKSLRSLNKEVVAGHKSETFQLFNQLLTHGSDQKDGTLQPLRRWILHASDRNKQLSRQREEFVVDPSAQVLSRQDVADLLRDFNVVYSPEDMDIFIDDIKMSSAIYDYFSETDTSPLHFRPSSSNNGKLDEFSIDPSNLLHCLLQSRPSWAQRNQKLSHKIKKLLSRASTNSVETLLARLRSFARYTNLFSMENELVIDFSDDEDGENDYADLMDKKVDKPKQVMKGESTSSSSNRPGGVNSAEAFITKEAFTQVIHSCGLNLSTSDIDFLADESDASLEPNRIRVGILLEALSDSEESGGLQDVLNTVREQFNHDVAEQNLHKQSSKHRDRGGGGKYGNGTRQRDTPNNKEGETPAAFAIKHLQTLLLNSAHVLRRSTTEWSCDVLSLMNGFDRGGGVCTPQDFVMGLHLLSVRLSGDLLANIPRISKSVDMIPYKKVLDLVFADSMQDERAQLEADSFEQSAYKDLMYGEEGEGEGERERGGGGESRRRTGSRAQRSASAPRHSHGRGGRQSPRSDGGGVQCPQSVSSLVHMVRKRLNIFIAGSKADDEYALSTLLGVFSRFDQNHDEFITPRNFCLAVSVLMDGDIPLLTKGDWEAVVLYFQQPSVVKQPRHTTTTNSRGKKTTSVTATSQNNIHIPAGMVHYISFVRLVLDASFAMIPSTSTSASGSRLAGRDGASSGGQRMSTRASYGGSPSKPPRASSTGRSLTASRTSKNNNNHHNHHQHSNNRGDYDCDISRTSASTADRPSYQPVQFGRHGSAATASKKKSYVKTNLLAMSSRPAMFRADYDDGEEEQEYAQSNTLSGRGVVGARSDNNQRRSNLSRVNAPRVEHRYSAYENGDADNGFLDESADSDLLTGGRHRQSDSLSFSPNKSATSLREEANTLREMNRHLNKGMRKQVDYTVAIKELNDELQNILAVKAQATRGKSTMSAVLRTFLQMEDKNNSGTLSKHSTLAALNALGIVYHFWSKPSQKQLMEVLMAKCNGVVNIEDFMKIVYLP